eukprot:TRINITY_DN22490_c0_g1_i2.p1 TRINITY_DN22490_c0_g1~~TRINITY_DN22490_c0_g1_i2.p1  ORF type:complete len:533 (+),score=145.96 TRINITY_DN22490_c0_g1_i2:77-1675(+)
MAPKGKAKARSRSTTPTGKAKAKGKAKAAAAAPKAPPSPEELAARRLQALARGFLARRLLRRMREEKKRYDAEMAEAVRAAEVAALKAERRRADMERAKAEEKRRKAKELAETTKKALEAAFDGEVAALTALLDSGLPVDAKGAQNITPLSEAAAGGSEPVAKLLLERKCNPNSQGEFDRTPLWRAAYAGHLSLVALLLEHGGDPRIHDADGCCPVDISQKDSITEALRAWDISRTEDLVDEYESWAEDQRLQQDFQIKAAMRDLDTEYESAKTAHEAAQKLLVLAKVEFRNREKEHGLGLAAGSEHAIKACASADEQVQKAIAEAQAAQARFDAANLKRMKAAEDLGVEGVQLGREIFVKDLNDVLMRDIGDRIAKARTWPLLIDPTDCATKLVVYAGCVVLNFWKAQEMAPDRVRTALLTMIRAGGVLAIDLVAFASGIDRQLLAQPFEEVREGLFEELLSRELFAIPKGSQWPRYRGLVKPEEKEKFGFEHFDDARTAKFKFVVVTSSENPSAQLLEMFDVLRVSPGNN